VQHRAAGPDGGRRPAQDGGFVPFGVYLDEVQAGAGFRRTRRGQMQAQPVDGQQGDFIGGLGRVLRRFVLIQQAHSVRIQQAHSAKVLSFRRGDARHTRRARAARRPGPQRGDHVRKAVHGHGALEQGEHLRLRLQRGHVSACLGWPDHAGKGHGVGAHVGANIQHPPSRWHVGGQRIQFRLRPFAVDGQGHAHRAVEVEMVDDALAARGGHDVVFEVWRQVVGRDVAGTGITGRGALCRGSAGDHVGGNRRHAPAPGPPVRVSRMFPALPVPAVPAFCCVVVQEQFQRPHGEQVALPLRRVEADGA